MERSLGDLSHEGLAFPVQQLLGLPETFRLARRENDARRPLEGVKIILLERADEHGIKVTEQAAGDASADGLQFGRLGLVEQGDAAGARGDVFESACGVGEEAHQAGGRDRLVEGQPAQSREKMRAVDVILVQRLAESAQSRDHDDRLHKIGDGRFARGGRFEGAGARAVGFDEKGQVFVFGYFV